MRRGRPAVPVLVIVTLIAALPLWAAAAEAANDGRPMYRLYNPNSGEHFYTASEGERNVLTAVGWRDEGVGWTAPVFSGSPVYRLYNEYAGDHHYTASRGERDFLIKAGWRDEGIGWYSDDKKGVPLYRQYNPNAVTGAHNYTADKGENDMLVSVGWREEGIGWYGMLPKKDTQKAQETPAPSPTSVPEVSPAVSGKLTPSPASSPAPTSAPRISPSPPHDHEYVSSAETVWEEAVPAHFETVQTGTRTVGTGEYETVCIREAYDEEIRKTRYRCRKCGMLFDTDEEAGLHEIRVCGARYTAESYVEATVHHDAVFERREIITEEPVYEEVWVEEKAGGEYTVFVSRCRICGKEEGKE